VLEALWASTLGVLIVMKC